MEVKEKHWVILVVAVVLAVCGYMWFQKTAPERKYKDEIKQLRMITEHQSLDIEAYKQKIELEAIKKGINKGKPTYKLTPAERSAIGGTENNAPKEEE